MSCVSKATNLISSPSARRNAPLSLRFSALAIPIFAIILGCAARANAFEARPGYDERELACKIASGINPRTWIQDLNRINRQVVIARGAVDDKRAEEAKQDYDLRLPFLSHYIYLFLSEREFSDTFGFHDPRRRTEYDLNIWQVLVGLQLSKENRKSGDLIGDADLLGRLRRRAQDDGYLLNYSLPDKLESQADLMASFAPMASALTDWLLRQPRASVGQKDLFSKALEIAGDSYGALGLLASVTYLDAYGLPRSKNAVLSTKIKPVYTIDGDRVDHAGNLYHFWQYAARAVAQPELRMHLSFVSFGYEVVNQGDLKEREADRQGIRLGRLSDQAWRNRAFCARKNP